MTEAHLAVLRHRLNLQAKDAQLVHHPWHTVGHHAEVLGTYQHPRSLCEQRQLLHRLAIPEVVVAAVEVVVVETVEGKLVAVVERLIDIVELHPDARMKLTAVVMVAHEEHVAHQGI